MQVVCRAPLPSNESREAQCSFKHYLSVEERDVLAINIATCGSVGDTAALGMRWHFSTEADAQGCLSATALGEITLPKHQGCVTLQGLLRQLHSIFMVSWQLPYVLWCRNVLGFMASYSLQHRASAWGAGSTRSLPSPGNVAPLGGRSSQCVSEGLFPKNGNEELNGFILAGSVQGRVNNTQAAPGWSKRIRHPWRPFFFPWPRVSVPPNCSAPSCPIPRLASGSSAPMTLCSPSVVAPSNPCFYFLVLEVSLCCIPVLYLQSKSQPAEELVKTVSYSYNNGMNQAKASPW